MKHTSDYIRHIRTLGKYAFTVSDLEDALDKKKENVRKDLDRLRKKGEILNIRRGFYTVITDEYRNMGSIPVEFYIDDLMRYLNRKYYVGLYSAAMLHGAAHQQPQEYYIITNAPKLHTINKDNFTINFSEKSNFPNYGIEEKKTDTGYLKISNRELTFFDLIYFEKSLGGLNRIITILDELKEDIKYTTFKEVMNNKFPLTLYQRAGYIMDQIFRNEKISVLLEKRLKSQNTKTVLLSTTSKQKGNIDSKWKVKVNLNLQSEI
jgi:predicted transcriptional regulator of viral defense system